MIKFYKLIILMLVTVTATGQALLTESDLNNKTIDYGKAVGIVSGGGNVTLSGTASYSIPIYTPSGINGMIPSVSIHYSSGAGNGLAGYGWGLSASSSISFDTKNLYNDNVTEPDNINGNGPYILDGMRLMPFNGSSTEFRTESESFSKITADAAVSPTSFTVLTKSGLKMEYGINTNSKLLTSTNTPVVWYLSKTSDAYGNYIEYIYSTINSEKVLYQIVYTKNTALTTITPNTIQFNYSSRADENIFYSQQSNSTTVEPMYKKNKLSGIDIYSEGLLMKKYDFVYGTDGLYTYLNEVTETGYDNAGASSVLNSTVFKYGTTANATTTETYTGMTQAGKQADLYSGDFNGDGFDDLFVAYYTKTGSNPKQYSDYRVYLRNTAGSAFPTTASASGTFPTTTFTNGVSGATCSLYIELNVTDVDGNGKKDITIVKRGKTGLFYRLFGAYVLYGNASATSFTLQDYTPNMTSTYIGDINVSNYFITGDFDGDGRTDWITTSGNGDSVKLHLPSLNIYNKLLSNTGLSSFDNCLAYNILFADILKTEDFDADGKDDIIISSAQNNNYICQTQSGGVKTVYSIYADVALNIYEAGEIADNSTSTLDFTKYTGDFNGDGKTDVFIQPVIAAPATAKIRYATGKNQSANFTLTLGESIDTLKLRTGDESFLTADFNGDGKCDILHYYFVSTTHNMVIYYSNGTGFKRVANTVTLPAGYRPYTSADFNGDGRTEIIDTLAGGSGAFHVISIEPKGQERLLTKVKDGYERVTEFQYKLCSEPAGIYSLSTTESYPLTTFVPRSFKIYRMKSPDGTGSMSNTSYTEYSYADAVSHALKGYLGFKTFKSVDALTTLSSEQTNAVINNNTAFYLFGAVGSKTYYATTPTQLLTQTTPVYDIKDFGSKRYLLKNTQSTHINNVTDSKVVNTAVINDDGNVTSSSSTVMTVSGVVKQTNTMTVKNDIFLSGGAWMVSLPEEVIETSTYNAQGAATYTNATKYVYNAYRQPTLVTLFNNDAGGTHKVVKNYEYDAQAGVLLKATTTPAGETARFERYEYFDNKKTLKKTYVSAPAPAPSGELCTQEVEDYYKRSGLPTKVKHGYYANIYTEYKYDAFGRTTEIKQMPNNIVTATAYSLDNSVPTLNAISKIYTTQTDGPSQTAFYDRFGRVVKSGAQNFSGSTIFSETTFNAFGNVATTTAPDAAAGSGNVTNTYTYLSTNPNTNHFRLDKITNSLSGITQYTYYAAASGATKTKVQAPNGKYKEQTVDITGKLTKVTETESSVSATIDYEYNSQGNTTKITAAGVITTMEYDAYTGVQTLLNEPNSGVMTYTYNGFGELTEQQDAKGVKYQMQYDVSGRLKQKDRVANGAATPPVTAETTTYEYTAAGNNGAQQLQYVKIGGATKQTYGYDALHRANSYTEVADASNTFTTTTVYNPNNTVQSITYPNSYILNYAYLYGSLLSVNDGTTTLYTTKTTNKYNQPTRYTLGNTKATDISYQANGQPSNYTTTGIQNLSMVFNMADGNMTSRTDNTTPTAQTESFTYEFDRLKTITTNGVLQTNVFAANGNITTKPDAGNTYTYGHTTKKHAVTKIDYTCSGTAINYREGQTVTYTPFNKAATLQQKDTVGATSPTMVTNLVTYSYNPDENRNKSELKKDGVVQSVRYYHGNYEKLETYTGGALSGTKHIYYISGGNGLCAIATKEGSNPAVTYTYVYTDHLGSILKLTNSSGTVLNQQSFDAWGRLRNPNNWNDYSITGITQPANSAFGAAGAVSGGGWLTRGYTGHEHVPQVDLINMNGRMYDAVLGRMLSPDKYVQDGTNTQAYNRYSYVMNNPLKYTDPSGWKIKATWGQMAIDADESKSGGGGGSRYIGGLDLTGGGNLAMVSSMFYASNQLYSTYYNWSTGQYMNGKNEVSFSGVMGELQSKGQIRNASNTEKAYALSKLYGDGYSNSTQDGYFWVTWGSGGDNRVQINTKKFAYSSFGAGALTWGEVVPIAGEIAEMGSLVNPIIAGALATALIYDMSKRTYVTYTLKNEATGNLYVGRASGIGTPNQVMMKRFSGHHMKLFGFGDPVLDQYAYGLGGALAIRGREQDLIDAYGGINKLSFANRIEGTLANSINGISPLNNQLYTFKYASWFVFGPVNPLLLRK